jgi:hypothetical protein
MRRSLTYFVLSSPTQVSLRIPVSQPYKQHYFDILPQTKPPKAAHSAIFKL